MQAVINFQGFFSLSSFSALINLTSYLKSRGHKSGKYLHVVPDFSTWFKPIDFSCSARIKKQTLMSGVVSGLILFTCRKSRFSKHSVKLLYFKIDSSLVSYPLLLVSVLSISHPCKCCCWLSPPSCTGCNQWRRILAKAISTLAEEVLACIGYAAKCTWAVSPRGQYKLYWLWI